MLGLLCFASFAHADLTDFAQRIKCEVQTADRQSLRDLNWQQGISPLIRFDVESNGKSATADTNIIVRMFIGPSATNTTFAVRTNYLTGSTFYLTQWPTIGTNSGDSAWWYTVYFQATNGATYWTGNGDLYIEETTSTAEDGLNFIIPSAISLATSNSAGSVKALTGGAAAYYDATGNWSVPTTVTNAVTNAASPLSVSGGVMSYDGTVTHNESGATNVPAAGLAAGGTFPAINGSALTALNASNLGSGTVPNARLDPELSALAGLTSAADRLAYYTGSGTASLTVFSAFARTLVDDANAGAARTTLGVAIGSDVQAWDADLDQLAVGNGSVLASNVPGQSVTGIVADVNIADTISRDTERIAATNGLDGITQAYTDAATNGVDAIAAAYTDAATNGMPQLALNNNWTAPSNTFNIGYFDSIVFISPTGTNITMRPGPAFVNGSNVVELIQDGSAITNTIFLKFD